MSAPPPAGSAMALKTAKSIRAWLNDFKDLFDHAKEHFLWGHKGPRKLSSPLFFGALPDITLMSNPMVLHAFTLFLQAKNNAAPNQSVVQTMVQNSTEAQQNPLASSQSLVASSMSVSSVHTAGMAQA
ncbi:hypothetical protein BS47DRAFT_1360949 [Hydnum rufescens UP504]|uniref:Uncharacterized protein n=1 Tax=Hydnum rufescens UP504 TaxID=1448309 RepID=A0A9P6B124_9AGAM|nr:hypothetical protein BS47DRAFT_1360949 [Hydnum rufescens UP504]